jgi:hypothetical protein
MRRGMRGTEVVEFHGAMAQSRAQQVFLIDGNDHERI